MKNDGLATEGEKELFIFDQIKNDNSKYRYEFVYVRNCVTKL